MSTATHARRRFSRFAALFRYDPARPPHPRLTVGVPGFEVSVPAPPPAFSRDEPHGIATPETLAALVAQAEAAAPVHMVSDETAVMPCCGLTEFQVPLTDCVTLNPRLVTCRKMAANEPTAPWGPWDRPDGDVPHSEPETPLECEYQRFYGWGLTLPDNRAPMAREYVPRRHSPDIAADLTGLPLFRETVSRRTRHSAGECLCGSALDGQAWGERMVRAGMHLTGMEAARILAAAPPLTLAAAVALSDEGEAA